MERRGAIRSDARKQLEQVRPLGIVRGDARKRLEPVLKPPTIPVLPMHGVIFEGSV